MIAARKGTETGLQSGNPVRTLALLRELLFNRVQFNDSGKRDCFGWLDRIRQAPRRLELLKATTVIADVKGQSSLGR